VGIVLVIKDLKEIKERIIDASKIIIASHNALSYIK
jgi:hypothetical protein